MEEEEEEEGVSLPKNNHLNKGKKAPSLPKKRGKKAPVAAP